MEQTIVLLGAGGASFTIALLKDLILTETLSGSTLRLVDIDEGRLKEAKEIAESYNREAGTSIKVEAYLDRRDALDGAGFVICAVKIGGYEPLEAERKIAQSHGYYRGIGDRVSCYFGGVGAYLQIKFLEDVANDMMELCPDAWLVQTANPVFDGTNYLTRYTDVKTVGVCHGHFLAYNVAKIMGLDKDKMSAEIIGFNHYNMLTDFRYEGKDAYPLLDKWIAEESEAYWKSPAYLESTNNYGAVPEELSPGAIDFYRIYGLLPIGDAVRSATPWWHHTDFATKEKWYGPNGGFDSEVCWAGYINDKTVYRDAIKDVLSTGKPITELSPLEKSGELHIPFINSVVTDTYERFILNIPNNGCIPGIPDDVMVEIPAVSSARGVQGIKMDPLPRRIMDNVIYPRMRTMNNLHEAYRNGDRSVLVLELMHDNRTRSYEQAKNLIDELLAQPWNKEADAHYR
ncbi:MAG: hypothetical protein FWC13_06005 [Oscillospiraceae bacterium]|nr:hypothetical protein [Oscillospiraceae bacterium]